MLLTELLDKDIPGRAGLSPLGLECIAPEDIWCPVGVSVSVLKNSNNRRGCVRE